MKHLLSLPGSCWRWMAHGRIRRLLLPIGGTALVVLAIIFMMPNGADVPPDELRDEIASAPTFVLPVWTPQLDEPPVAPSVTPSAQAATPGPTATPRPPARPSATPPPSTIPPATTAQARSELVINPGDNIQAAVSANPEGATFIIRAGVHIRQSVVPKAGQSFIGEPGAILDGENVSLYAFHGSARDVTIRGLVVERYMNPVQQGAIHGRAAPNGALSSGWRIEGNEIRNNYGGGIRLAPGMQVVSNNIHHNGQIGLTGGEGSGILIENNEIAFNNTRNVVAGWEAGGTKFVLTDGLVVRGNFVHDNKGPGLWTDIDNINTLYEGNTVINNERMGIFHEISYAAVIRNNVVKGNGYGFSAWLWGGQITIAGSSNVEIYQNTVEVGNGDGIVLIQQNRGNGKFGPHLTQNNHVHHNTITYLTGEGVSGAAADFQPEMMWGGNNRFDHNIYRGVDSAARRWEWRGMRTWDDFKSQGQEANGTVG
ncbi:MAG: hypothetical protein GEU75_02330 [Dehalococcoidia bacterium]|nr:hypothetical protein [Dehalococcoidia bacterium]